MNRVFDKDVIHKIISFFIFVALLFLLSSLSLVFLPKSGVEKAIEKRVNIPYVNHKIGDIFNVSEKQALLAEEPKEQIYELNNLELKAIFADEGGNGWIVLVDKGTQKSEVLKNGDIYKGYELVSIERDSALFENGGKKYTVRINKPKLQELDTPPMSAQIPVATKPISTPTIRAVPKREIERYKQDYNAIWQNIKIKERVEGGEITGFRVLWIKENSIFAQLGFEVGDIIKAVNNKELKSYADAFKIYNNIHVHKSLKFTIIRDKQERELEYEVY